MELVTGANGVFKYCYVLALSCFNDLTIHRQFSKFSVFQHSHKIFQISSTIISLIVVIITGINLISYL